MMEATKGLGKRDVKGDTKGCFIFEIWFSSNNLTEAVMAFGTNIIGVVETNTKLLFKDNIDKLTNNWPVGSYLVLNIKTVVPRPLIDVG